MHGCYRTLNEIATWRAHEPSSVAVLVWAPDHAGGAPAVPINHLEIVDR